MAHVPGRLYAKVAAWFHRTVDTTSTPTFRNAEFFMNNNLSLNNSNNSNNGNGNGNGNNANLNRC
jgi:hypothetical protein